MSSTTPAAPPDPPPDATPEEIEADIEAARERLASSVDALTAKLDVKAQAKQKAQETSAQAKQKAQETSAQAKQKAQETSERVGAGAQHAYQRVRTTSPAVLGAGVVGLVATARHLRRAAAALLSPKLSAPGRPPHLLDVGGPLPWRGVVAKEDRHAGVDSWHVKGHCERVEIPGLWPSSVEKPCEQNRTPPAH